MNNACVQSADGAARASGEYVPGVLHMFSAQQACSNFSCLSTISRVFCLYYFLIQGLASKRVPLGLTVQDSLVVGCLLSESSSSTSIALSSSSPPPPPLFSSFPTCRQSDSRLLTAQGSVSNVFLYIEAVVAHTYSLSISLLAGLLI